MVVREGSPTDVEEIARVHVQSWQEAYRGQLPDAFLDGLTVASRVRMWTRVFEDRSSVLVVANEGRIIGISSFGDEREGERENGGEIYTMYVLKEFWGKGVGQLLMDGVLDHLRHRPVVNLWVLESNERALAFYSKHGFAPNGETKVVERPGFQLREVRLSRTLP